MSEYFYGDDGICLSINYPNNLELLYEGRTYKSKLPVWVESAKELESAWLNSLSTKVKMIYKVDFAPKEDLFSTLVKNYLLFTPMREGALLIQDRFEAGNRTEYVISIKYPNSLKVQAINSTLSIPQVQTRNFKESWDSEIRKAIMKVVGSSPGTYEDCNIFAEIYLNLIRQASTIRTEA